MQRFYDYRFSGRLLPFRRGNATILAWVIYRFGVDGQKVLEFDSYRFSVENVPGDSLDTVRLK